MLHDTTPSTRARLSALWGALMLLYIYADFFALFPPGHIEEIIAGKIGPFDVTQTALLMAATLMALPALMVAFNQFFGTTLVRWTNVIMGALYALVNVGNLVGETWLYYWALGLIELGITLIIVLIAFRWPNADPQA